MFPNKHASLYTCILRLLIQSLWFKNTHLLCLFCCVSNNNFVLIIGSMPYTKGTFKFLYSTTILIFFVGYSCYQIKKKPPYRPSTAIRRHITVHSDWRCYLKVWVYRVNAIIAVAIWLQLFTVLEHTCKITVTLIMLILLIGVYIWVLAFDKCACLLQNSNSSVIKNNPPTTIKNKLELEFISRI